MHYLITGHTGFKGSWLTLMLEMQGHTVSGIALDPPTKSLFNQANLSPIFKHDIRLDIRNRGAIKQAMEMIDPDVIVHLAAQPLVRESYRIPVETFDINVIGTLNVLEAMRELKNLKAALIITTDKVYKNQNHLRGYVETDELGGDDPYSASKAAADIATQAWIKSFARVPMAIARAGNVIGGGDWAQDRIIPDLVNAYSNDQIPTLRYPDAIRPWEHVLDCLNGYLELINHMLETKTGGEWNFGPLFETNFTVGQLVTELARHFTDAPHLWNVEKSPQLHETGHLLLDSRKARTILSWTDILDFEMAIKWTADWYKNVGGHKSREITANQIVNFNRLITKVK
jgi:CDP-glucose 4,6-dehydratase